MNKFHITVVNCRDKTIDNITSSTVNSYEEGVNRVMDEVKKCILGISEYKDFPTNTNINISVNSNEDDKEFQCKIHYSSDKIDYHTHITINYGYVFKVSNNIICI